MCGIAGKVSFRGGAVDDELLMRMCRQMKHRGPDGRGIYNEGGAGLAMQRLAIIDIEGGDQPVFSEDGQVVVVMNGEIYNFRELRAELVRQGHRFTSRGDTEVLVHLYEEAGERLVDRLHGMFAFAIWDRRRRRLLLGRDRVGKKPLFWSRHGDDVWFASELMPLLQDPCLRRGPSPRAIASYLTFQYVPHPLSAFDGIEKLEPATTLSITESQTTARRYWALDYSRKTSAPPDELEEQLRGLIWEATRSRLVSEVPLGAFLSGGVDSSAVVAAMADQMSGPVKTFSIGFPDPEFDELAYARLIAERFSTDHHEFVVEPHASEIMPKLARHYGEPFADSSALPSFYLAELTSRHVTVALNGDGGDESFAGYGRYVVNGVASRFDWIPPRLRQLAPAIALSLGVGASPQAFRARLTRRAYALSLEPRERYAHWMSAFPATLRAEVLQPEFLNEAVGGGAIEDVIGMPWRRSSARTDLDRMLDVDVNTYLPGDLLAKMDIATMAHSVEARSPLLDHRVMEFAAALPPELKLRGGEGKRLLKSSLRGVLPDAVLDRRKMGFGVPLARWFREELRELPRQVLMPADARVRSYVKPAAIARMIDEHQAGQADHALRLWVLLQLEYWHHEVLESPIMPAAEATSAGRPVAVYGGARPPSTHPDGAGARGGQL